MHAQWLGYAQAGKQQSNAIKLLLLSAEVERRQFHLSDKHEAYAAASGVTT